MVPPFWDRFRSRPPALRLARLGPADAPSCATLHGRGFAHPWSEADFERLLTGPSSLADGAWLDQDGLVGFVLSRLAADEAEILTIVVAPAARGKGIGSALIARNQAAVAAAGAKTWFLEVDAANQTALALYARFGFTMVGEREAYYGAGRKALVMRRDLT